MESVEESSGQNHEHAAQVNEARSRHEETEEEKL